MSDLPRDRDQGPPASASAEIFEGASLRRAGAIHDINQMLAVIMGRAELLMQNEEKGSRLDDLSAIVLAAGDAAVMLKRLQRGLPLGGREREETTVSLDQVVRAVSLMIRPDGTGRWSGPEELSSDPTWVLELDVPDELFTTVPGQVVREVLSNLLVNALEVLPDGGRILVDAIADRERVFLTVEDNGPGLDKETALRIFEPGFSSREGEFRGIGLAGSRQLLKCFDGRLNLGPGTGPGARFVLDLPRAERPAAGTAAKSPGDGASKVREAGFPVLVVDDEPAVRDMLADVLGELNCRVVAVRDAQAAEHEFTPGAFGLALVDQNLPGRSGLELARRLREQDPFLVVALISGWGGEGVLAEAESAVVDLTATKPLEWTRINEILDQGARLNRERRGQAARGAQPEE